MNLGSSWEYIQQVAKQRLANNKTQYHVDEFGEIIEVIGAAGELAARRFLGMSEQLHKCHDNGVDLVYKGKRVDVKATHWTSKAVHRNLQWPENKPFKCDIIIFVMVDASRKHAVPVGYATRSDVLSAPVNKRRKWPCHEIPITKLHPLWELTLVPKA